MDCGFIGPPFMFEFDHRDPELKEFGVSDGGVTRAIAKIIAESLKCDMVCPNCHRMRTHIQRCGGCADCGDEVRFFHRHKTPVVIEN